MNSANCFCLHPQTLLRELETHNDLNPPNCVMCECPIGGKMFNCGACYSNLHPFCKSCPPFLSSTIHPDLNHHLVFVNRDFPSPVGGDSLRRPYRQCMVCREDIRGVSYACLPCNFYVHPNCSQLPRLIPHGPETNHMLELQVGGHFRNVDCHICQSQCSRWVYRCDLCSINVHLKCIIKPPGYESGESSTTTTTTTRGRDVSSSTRQRHFNTYGPYNHQGLGYSMPYYNMYNNYNPGFPHGAGIYNHIPNHNNYYYAGGVAPAAGAAGVAGIGGSIVGILGTAAGSIVGNLISSLFPPDFFFG